MNGNSLRGVLAAVLIGTASVAGATMLTATTAQAAGVRPQVGKPLQEAINFAKEGKSAQAMAALHRAESVHGLTADEQKVIAETRQYVEVKTGNFSGGVTNATAAQAKFAIDYNNRRYHDVVTVDQEYLRKFGALDESRKEIIAQAYYQMGDYRGALNYINHNLNNSSSALMLKMAVANKLGDTEALAQSARQLVLQGQPKFWTYMLMAADHASGLSDEQTLDIYRIRLLTGNMRNADDYSTATQIAIQLGYPQEGLAIQQRGFAAKVLAGTRQERLLALAKKDAAAQVAELGKLESEAKAAKTGGELVHLAEVYWGTGKYKEALAAVEDGIKKGGLKDRANAEMVKGMALVGLKQQRAALLAFKAASTDAKAKVVAGLWDVYARTSK
ncbi:MAG: hypothetical protein KGO02_16565 [Alphaproteobacteria bacterium]|nr:hypothetical protein [Alphaproteobacteria bacterium]